MVCYRCLIANMLFFYFSTISFFDDLSSDHVFNVVTYLLTIMHTLPNTADNFVPWDQAHVWQSH
jgi:hypothetical protein